MTIKACKHHQYKGGEESWPHSAIVQPRCGPWHLSLSPSAFTTGNSCERITDPFHLGIQGKLCILQ